MISPFEQRRLKDAKGLLFVYQFGWLRTAELGKLMWPDSPDNRHAADRLVRSWIERQLVIVRELPDGAGRALVLATAGVRLLAENGIKAGCGKGIGRTNDDGWLPPASWRHDLIAHGVLCELHRRGYHVYPEMELRRLAEGYPKIPDGFAVKDGEGIYVEVENARKSGYEMRKLADALSIVASGQAASIAGFKPNAAMVAFLPSAVDERGYNLSHQTRVRNAIQAVAKNELSIYWAKCTLRGNAGVGQVDIQKEQISTDRASRILKVLNSWGWHPHQEGGTYSSYNKHIAHVWEDDYGWCYSVDTFNGQPIEASHAADITAAKRAAASVLARL